MPLCIIVRADPGDAGNLVDALTPQTFQQTHYGYLLDHPTTKIALGSALAFGWIHSTTSLQKFRREKERGQAKQDDCAGSSEGPRSDEP